MKKEDICYMPVCDMADKIESQELTSQEITEILIERIERINPIINAYCIPTFELAREMAKKADNSLKKGHKLGLLHGIPLSIKDELEVKDFRTTFGTKLFENNISVKDAVVVERLREAGSVILGKTNLPPLGSKGITDNLIFGPTRNPWNIERTSGGSSGGAAAAVASGLSPLALGSDGGGSIRIPSSFCGVYGIKPTYGRIPQTTVSLLGYISTFVQRGPIVRYVKDAALMLDIMVGEHPLDINSLPKPNFSYLEKINEKPKNLKIGYSLTLGFAKTIDPEVKKNVLNAIDKFENFDWPVEKSKIRIRNAELTMWTIWTTSFAKILRPVLKKRDIKIDDELFGTMKIGMTFSKQDIRNAKKERERISETISRYFKNYDILITPTLACPAFEIDKSFPKQIDGKEVNPGAWMPFTYPFNMSRHPAASIPCGWSSEGLPIGMQIVGKMNDELSVLQVSKAFEEIAPWQDKRPQFN